MPGVITEEQFMYPIFWSKMGQIVALFVSVSFQDRLKRVEDILEESAAF
jgi:hypothetical protein